jgi:hypothetical protein
LQILSHDPISGVSTFQGIRESTDLFRHDDTMPEEFLVPVIAVLRVEQIELTTEFEEVFSIIVRYSRRVSVVRVLVIKT